MALAGRNFYISTDLEEWTKGNPNVLPLNGSHTFTGLPSATEHYIAATNIDGAGLESELSDPISVETNVYVPGMDPLPLAIRNNIDALCEDCLSKGMGPGIAIAVESDLGWYRKAYGLATYGGRALTLDDHFRIGSLTKTFTATAVLKCIEDGLLSLEDKLADFDTDEYVLSTVPNANKITVRHMLMMRSGIASEQADWGLLLNLLLFPGNAVSEATRLNIIRSGTPMFEPGTQFFYTNGNYLLLGLIVRAIRGRPIRNVVLEDIIQPLGLTETSWPTTASMPSPYAAGHGGLTGGRTQNTTGVHPSFAGAAGAIVSNISDMLEWAKHMRDYAILSEQTTELWESVFCPIPLGGSAPPECGYGLGTYDVGDFNSHPGSWTGYECFSMYNRSTGTVIAGFENSQTTEPDLPGVPIFTKVFAEIASMVDPGSMDPVPYVACTVPTDPYVGAPAPINLGWGGISNLMYSNGTGTGTFTAPEGADVYMCLCWDRTGSVTLAEYAGENMELVAGPVLNNNTAGYGGQAIYRAAGAGTGEAETVRFSGSGGWHTCFCLAFEGVTDVGTPMTNYGVGTTQTQDVTVGENEQILQVFAAGAGGGPIYIPNTITGAKNRKKGAGTYPMICISTTRSTGTITATSSGTNRWSSIALPLEIDL